MDHLKKRLKVRWTAFCLSAGFTNKSHIETVFREIVIRYSEKHRKFHTLKHIFEVISAFDVLRWLSKNPHAVEAAIWFHDIIYNVGSSTNEKESADFARDMLLLLGANKKFIKLVKKLIIATRHGEVVLMSDDEKVIADSDLAGLAKTEEEFDRDRKNIRKEYKRYSDVEFNEGTSNFFKKLIKRGFVFHLSWFGSYDDREKKAIENINSVIISPA